MDENFDNEMTKLYMELERLRENGQTAQADRLLTKIESFERKSEENQWLREASQFPKKKRRKRNRSVNRKWTEDTVKEAIEAFMARNHRYPKSKKCNVQNILPDVMTFKKVMGMTPSQYGKQYYLDFLKTNR